MTNYSIHDSKTGEEIKRIAVDDSTEIESLSSETAEGHFTARHATGLEDLGDRSVYAILH